MLVKDLINNLKQLGQETEIYFGLKNDEYCEIGIEPTEDTDTSEYYYRVVGI